MPSVDADVSPTRPSCEHMVSNPTHRSPGEDSSQMALQPVPWMPDNPNLDRSGNVVSRERPGKTFNIQGTLNTLQGNVRAI